MNILGVIPARYGSTRFPGKPLVDILGKSMICRVYEQASKSAALDYLAVATDDERIASHVRGFGGNVTLTGHHVSGTDRCAEAASAFDCRVVINIQGDEPLLDPRQIDLVVSLFEEKGTQISTLIKKIKINDDLHSPHVVKVVRDLQNKALYFSRAPIPFLRDQPAIEWPAHQDYFKHIGIYGYQKEVLTKIHTLSPSFLELSESLEQLRWLENGYKISLTETTFDSEAVDTPQDLQKIIDRLNV